jgi:small subunit ribosomal protein S6
MNKYELTIVVAGAATPAKVKSVSALVEKLIKTMKGEIKKSDEWGEINLAYKIGKNDSGKFVHYKLELESKSVKAINEKLKMEQRQLKQPVLYTRTLPRSLLRRKS